MNPFEQLADRYDKWFESAEGRILFAAETACLRLLPEAPGDSRLEVGVGTGRFAAALGIRYGVDPALPVLQYAKRRGITVALGAAEALPFPDAAFHGVWLVVTICFVRDPLRALAESARVLEPGGLLYVGLVPRDTAWGKLYEEKKRAGHPFYSSARFYTTDEVTGMARKAGLEYEAAASCLPAPPDRLEANTAPPVPGVRRGAGFVALCFRRSPETR